MPIVFLLLFGGGAFLLYSNMKNPIVPPELTNDLAYPSPQNKMGLPDINPGDQQGGYDQSSDSAFLAAHDKWGVPFALLKAHAIRESALDPSAYRQEPSGKASYGLMQVLWWKNSNRFNKYGHNDDEIGDGSALYESDVNVDIAAQLIMDNWGACAGNLRDCINMYNTGVKESVRKAPGNYVDDVLNYYSKLIGRGVI